MNIEEFMNEENHMCNLGEDLFSEDLRTRSNL